MALRIGFLVKCRRVGLSYLNCGRFYKNQARTPGLGKSKSGIQPRVHGATHCHHVCGIICTFGDHLLFYRAVSSLFFLDPGFRRPSVRASPFGIADADLISTNHSSRVRQSRLLLLLLTCLLDTSATFFGDLSGNGQSYDLSSCLHTGVNITTP